MEEIKRELREIKGELKEINSNTRSTTEIISEMQKDVNSLIELNREQKQINKDIKLLLDEVMTITKQMRKDVDKIKGTLKENQELQLQEVM